MADESTCRDGVPWCTAHLDPEHRSSAGLIHLSGPDRGFASARASRYNEQQRVVLVAGAGDLPTELVGVLMIRTPRETENAALLLERMATATPAQHRKLAAQLRAASAVAFGNPETKEKSDGN